MILWAMRCTWPLPRIISEAVSIPVFLGGGWGRGFPSPQKQCVWGLPLVDPSHPSPVTRRYVDMNQETSDWTDRDSQIFLKYLLNQTVAIAGTYQHTLGDDQREWAYAYSGCVVASHKHWHVLTAGHAIKGHIRDSSSNGIQITGRVLADCFGKGASHISPIPFDPVTRVDHIHYDEGGLDYAVFTLTDNECQLLQKNGIKSLPFRDKPLKHRDFDRHFIVGFPDEKTAAIPSSGQAGIGLQPVCVPVRPIDANACPKANGRLAFEIVDKGELRACLQID